MSDTTTDENYEIGPRERTLTMVAVWGELTQDEREGICRCCKGITQGELSLTTIAKVLKAMYYNSNYAWSSPSTQGMATQQMPNHTHSVASQNVNPNQYHQAGAIAGAAPSMSKRSYVEAVKKALGEP